MPNNVSGWPDPRDWRVAPASEDSVQNKVVGKSAGRLEGALTWCHETVTRAKDNREHVAA